MSPCHRKKNTLLKIIQKEKYRLCRHQALRLLYQQGINVQLVTHFSFTYPFSDIHSIEYESSQQMVKLILSATPLTGMHGALPTPYQVMLQHRPKTQQQLFFRHLIQYLNERLIEFDHQIWRHQQLGVQIETAHYFLLFNGEDNAPHGSKYFPALHQQHSRNLHTLAQLIEARLGHRVALNILPGCHSRSIQKSSLSGTHPARLTHDAHCLGRHTQVCTHTLTIELMPLAQPHFQRMLPGQPGALQLMQLLTEYLGVPPTTRLLLHVKPETVLPLRLCATTTHALGHHSWLTSSGWTTSLSGYTYYIPTPALD